MFKGALVVQQLLQLQHRFVSLLSTEPTLRKVVPELRAIDARLREVGVASRGASGSCVGTANGIDEVPSEGLPIQQANTQT